MNAGHCGWAFANEMTCVYHDTEWGVPLHDDRQMFERLTLECLQCGRSSTTPGAVRSSGRNMAASATGCVGAFGGKDHRL